MNLRIGKLHRGCYGLYVNNRLTAELVTPKPAFGLISCPESDFLRIFGSYIPIGKWLPPSTNMKSWGFSIQEDYLYLDWNRACKLIKLPWSWIHINAAHAFLGVNGEWLKFCEADKADAMRWQLPYNYTLDNGNVQQVTASVTVEKRVWKMRILPFIRKQYTSIEVEFDQEVGDRAGSWKGGCIACNYKLQRNEDPVSCLYRMEQERRFP